MVQKPEGDIIAYQIRQSFKPGEITPEKANRIGYETAMRFTKGNHNKKPAETRDRIVSLMGDVPRVELFARQKTEGWDTWGNEMENDLELAA